MQLPLVNVVVYAIMHSSECFDCTVILIVMRLGRVVATNLALFLSIKKIHRDDYQMMIIIMIILKIFSLWEMMPDWCNTI